jgi:hypothetical protein
MTRMALLTRELIEQALAMLDEELGRAGPAGQNPPPARGDIR